MSSFNFNILYILLRQLNANIVHRVHESWVVDAYSLLGKRTVFKKQNKCVIALCVSIGSIIVMMILMFTNMLIRCRPTLDKQAILGKIFNKLISKFLLQYEFTRMPRVCSAPFRITNMYGN